MSIIVTTQARLTNPICCPSVREPTSRFVSHFYYNSVSQHGKDDNLENFKDYTRNYDPDNDTNGYEDMFKVFKMAFSMSSGHPYPLFSFFNTIPFIPHC